MLVFVLRNRINGNLYSIKNDNVQKPRPVLIAFKNKQDAMAISHTIKNIDDIFTRSSKDIQQKPNMIMKLQTVQDFLCRKKDKHQIDIDKLSFENLVRRCTMNCLDIMLIEDKSGLYTMYHLNVMDTDEYVFHLDNVMKYW